MICLYRWEEEQGADLQYFVDFYLTKRFKDRDTTWSLMVQGKASIVVVETHPVQIPVIFDRWSNVA